MQRRFGDPCAGVADPHLRRACELAERARGATYPNPLVGCVLVKDDVVVGEGAHEHAGGPHAEIVALNAAGSDAVGSTAFVTLEPCAHTGRTGPCADALAASGVARVVIGMRDPHELARGGADRLHSSGVQVEFAPDPSPFEQLNTEWLHRVRTGRPYVRVKVAVTLDGRVALAPGVRSSITGQAAREFTMRLRSECDAVLIGTGTLATDDPSLTVRTADGTPVSRQPRRVVLARTEQPSAAARMFGDGLGSVSVLLPDVLEPDQPLVDAGADIVPYDAADGLSGAFCALGRLDVTCVLVEAGPRLFTALYEASLMDELIVLHAGGVAGAGAPSLFVGAGPDDTASLERTYRAVEASVVGSDVASVWRRRT